MPNQRCSPARLPPWRRWRRRRGRRACSSLLCLGFLLLLYCFLRDWRNWWIALIEVTTFMREMCLLLTYSLTQVSGIIAIFHRSRWRRAESEIMHLIHYKLSRVFPLLSGDIIVEKYLFNVVCCAWHQLFREKNVFHLSIQAERKLFFSVCFA